MSFSVVTPNFNHGEVLARAVDAVMAQEPRPAELIIINDGSTDDSLAVIGELKALSGNPPDQSRAQSRRARRDE